MGRKIRWIPDNSTVEITNRAFQGRFLLLPTEEARQLILGVLGRAQRLYPVEIHAFAFLSNHFHLLITARNTKQMSDFVGYAKANIAKELGRIHGWRGSFWEGRYHHSLVSAEELAQVRRLKYLLSQGTKEGLVSHPMDWPGAHCAKALLTGATIAGVWHDRTREYAARMRGHDVPQGAFSRQEVVEVSPLPCWRGRDSRAIRRTIRELVGIIRREQPDQHRLKPSDLVRRSPRHRPAELKQSPAVWFHCASRRAFEELHSAFQEVVTAYSVASDRFRRGDLSVQFPEGTFPPRRPFVSA